jgi:hypothetical protein
VRKLSEWLSTDALTFVFHFLGSGKKDRPGSPLEDERALLETILREPIAAGAVQLVETPTAAAVEKECSLKARRSLVHCLALSTKEVELAAQDTLVTRLRLDGPVPALGDGDAAALVPDADTPSDGWHAVVEQVLRRWI